MVVNMSSCSTDEGRGKASQVKMPTFHFGITDRPPQQQANLKGHFRSDAQATTLAYPRSLPCLHEPSEYLRRIGALTRMIIAVVIWPAV